MLEAIACGTPVICNKGCGIVDAIDGKVELAAPYGEQELQEVIQHMLSDDKMRQGFSEKGKLLVHQWFNQPKIAEQLEGIYWGCLPQRIRPQG